MCNVHYDKYHSADTRRWINVGLTLVQRRRRWTHGKPTLIQRLVSAGQWSIEVDNVHNLVPCNVGMIKMIYYSAAGIIKYHYDIKKGNVIIIIWWYDQKSYCITWDGYFQISMQRYIVVFTRLLRYTKTNKPAAVQNIMNRKDLIQINESGQE